MARRVNDTTAFKVAGFESNRWLLWEKPDSTWAWTLAPVAGGRTRLVVRLKAHFDRRVSPGGALLSLILLEFGDFPMMRKRLLGVRERAERSVVRLVSVASRRASSVVFTGKPHTGHVGSRMAGVMRRVTIARMIRKTSIPLVRCRECASPLLQPLEVSAAIGGLSIVSRFCPECTRRDIVVASDSAVQAWLRQGRRIAARMEECADLLAANLVSG